MATDVPLPPTRAGWHRIDLSRSRENWLDLDIPPQIAPSLAEPWALASAAVGIGDAQVDVLHMPPSDRRGGLLGDAGPDLANGRLQVRVRPHLAGDRLLCVLLHEAIHVRVDTDGRAGVWTIGRSPHGPGFRAEVRGLCARIGAPPPRRFYCWPDESEARAVAAAVRKAASTQEAAS